MIYTVLLTVHFMVCLFLIILIVVQHGKGAEMGAAFGSGASQTVFGSTGSANFLTKSTAFLAAIFFLSSLGLTYWVSHHYNNSIVISPDKEDFSSESIPSSEQSDIKSAPEEKIPSNGAEQVPPNNAEQDSPSVRVIPAEAPHRK